MIYQAILESEVKSAPHLFGPLRKMSMAHSAFLDPRAASNSDRLWPQLKQAIAASSGFKRWQLEHQLDIHKQGSPTLDTLVQSYLRETLETLAY